MDALARIVAVLGVLALAWTAAAADLEVGKAVYAKKCASCHGADGKGNPKMAVMLKASIPDLTNGSAKSEADLATLISEGKRPMPSFGKSLSKEEIEAVIHYARSLKK